MKFALFVALLAVAALTGGCSQVPTAGPTTSQVLDQAAKDHQQNFDLINISNQVVAALANPPDDAHSLNFGDDGRPPAQSIGVGDSVVVTIWEASGGALFSESASTGSASSATSGASGAVRSVTLPEQIVGTDGAISVPFAGRVRVAGRTIPQVESTIKAGLAEAVIQPQVIVTVSKNVSDDVSIFGEFVSGARIPLSDRGERLLDVIATAGGAKAPIYDTYVRVARGSRIATIPMDQLTSDPAANIYVWPGDVITLIKNSRTFSVFGAAHTNPVIPIDENQLNLAEAIAKAGGLDDTRADPTGVFLFRFEQPAVVKAMGARPILATQNGLSPVLYHLDLRQVDGYFLAERFPIENKDMIYVANAQFTNLQKLFTLIGTITGPVVTGAVVARPSGR
ncbi:MAG: polysaccharide biosynthesis/export family protein [Acetobacteraceae bacterium]